MLDELKPLVKKAISNGKYLGAPVNRLFGHV
jgi:hypothetical protein